MTQKRVAVLMGGMSSEHDISLKTGKKIIAGLRKTRWQVLPVKIQRNGAWRFPAQKPMPLGLALEHLRKEKVHCVFPALHGAYGEDGRIQGVLDMARIPYVGSGCMASAVAMDKIHSKTIVKNAGLRVARQVVITEAEWQTGRREQVQRVRQTLGFPCVVKSPCQGSSIGMGIAADDKAFSTLVDSLFNLDTVVMVEQYIQGTEVTCGVLELDGPGSVSALPVTEIRPVTASFFDFTAKYTQGACEEITPAPLPARLIRTIQRMAVKAHQALGCRHLSRSDLIVQDGKPVWIEINTLPGMTETSLVPQAAKVAGIAFPELLERLLDAALKDNRK